MLTINSILFFYLIESREIKSKIIFIISFKYNILTRNREVFHKRFFLNRYNKINRVILVILEKRR